MRQRVIERVREGRGSERGKRREGRERRTEEVYNS